MSSKNVKVKQSV